MNVFEKEHLQKFAEEVFQAMGASEKDAAIATEVLISADLRGIDSHGISRLKGYIALWEAGRINMNPNIQIVRQRKSTLTIDGDSGLGLVVGPFAMNTSIQLCKEYGSAWVAVRNSNHYGIAGYYAMKASEQGMMGMSMTNATPFIPPTHSKEAMLGTNPMAYSFPTNKEFPLTIDLATASVARGKLEIAKRENKQIPKGWVVDRNGKPSTDVDILEKGGLLTPLGSLEELSSHKGYALGSLVDILTAVLSGANYGPWVPPFVPYLALKDDLPGKGLGHFFGSMEIDGFRPLDEFKKHMDHWIDTFKNAERIHKDQEVYVPGEKEWIHQKERTKSGIPLNAKVIDALETISKKFSIPF